MEKITFKKYGSVNGHDILLYTLTNASGMIVKIISYGGAVCSIIVSDKEGKKQDVALGFDTLEEYELPQNPHFGSITGRFANRIAKGKFVIDGKSVQVNTNNNGNTLHGGISGFNRKIWTPQLLENDRLKLSYTSEDGEEGFPGNCKVEVVYQLTDDNELKIEYTATADQPTPVNITNHSYFNFSGGKEATVKDHIMWINGDKYIPVDSEFLPTGVLAPVEGTVMDFTQPTRVGNDIDKVAGGGFDHTYVINKEYGKLGFAGAVYNPGTGIYMQVFTTEPGVQFYSGNFLDGTLTGKNGTRYVQHGGLCMEAQHFPDSPNQLSFPDTILRPGKKYSQTTIYKFSTKEE